MSPNNLAVVPQASASVPALFPSAEELTLLKEMAGTFIASGLLPTAVKKPEQAILIMLKGREAGIPPLQALAHIHVIEGKPSMSAELMLSQLYKNIPGFVHQFIETSNAACRIKVKRPGIDWSEFSFTIEDARAAGLANRPVWKAYTAAMLRARCISSMARAVGPDALAGISYTPEELGADVDASGNLISTPQGQEKVNTLASKLGLKPEPKDVQSEVAPREPSPRERNEQAALDHMEGKPSPVIVTPKSPEPDLPIHGATTQTIRDQQSKDTRPNAFYQVKAGPLKGRMLKDADDEMIIGLIGKTKAHYAGKEMAPDYREFVEKAQAYLAPLAGSESSGSGDLFENFAGGPPS